MKLYLPLAFAASVRHSFAAASLRGQEQKSSSVSSLTSSSSSLVGAGLCKDNLGRVYDRVTFSGVDTRDACESLCAPLGGDSNLVGYEYSDTLNSCNCRFTEGYVSTSQLGGVDNCPSGASTYWGGEACKVVPLGGSGVGGVTQSGVTQAGDDSKYDCFRNENFCESSSLLSGQSYVCPERELGQLHRRAGINMLECENWCSSLGAGCCEFWTYDDGYCNWRGFASGPVSLQAGDGSSRAGDGGPQEYASIICGAPALSSGPTSEA